MRKKMETIKLNKIEFTEEQTPMFDLEVKDNHNFILENGLITHNSGKSCCGFRLLENISAKNKNRPCYVIGSNPANFPSFIGSLEEMEEAPNGAIVLIDEGALEYNARESMGKKAVNLTKIMAIARHKNITLIYITQNTAIGDKNVLRLCDVLIFKNSSLMQEETERLEVKKFYKKINPFFKSHNKKERKTLTYIFSDEFCGFIKSGIPSFWNDKISKGYSEDESIQAETS